MSKGCVMDGLVVDCFMLEGGGVGDAGAVSFEVMDGVDLVDIRDGIDVTML